MTHHLNDRVITCNVALHCPPSCHATPDQGTESRQLSCTPSIPITPPKLTQTPTARRNHHRPASLRSSPVVAMARNTYTQSCRTFKIHRAHQPASRSQLVVAQQASIVLPPAKMCLWTDPHCRGPLLRTLPFGILRQQKGNEGGTDVRCGREQRWWLEFDLPGHPWERRGAYVETTNSFPK